MIASGSRRPDLVTLWLDAKARQLRRAAAPWRQVELGPTIALAREVLETNPADEPLKRAIKEAAQ